MNRKTAGEIFEILEDRFDLKNETGWDFISPYTVLVSTMLSAQATDKSVEKATEELYKVAKTPEEMVELGEEKLKKYIKSIGLYNNKAKNIILMSKQLIERFNSIVPQTREELVSLAGVGRKTANIVLNSVFNIPSIAVDTHVFRVSNRLGLTDSDNVLKSERQLLDIVPEKYYKNVNYSLVLLGRYCCKAQRPECQICPIYKLCEHYSKTLKNNDKN